MKKTQKKIRFWEKPIKAKLKIRKGSKPKIQKRTKKLPAAAPEPALEIKFLILWLLSEVWQLLLILESKSTLLTAI
jgi:hypothetical protein